MATGSGDLGPVYPVSGVRLAVVKAGVRYPDRDDLVVLEVAEGSTAAAVFTRNAFCAAPVTVARRHLAAAVPRYLLINTGNANAGTGAAGETDALTCCAALADLAGVAPQAVLPFSTGVIGEPLPTAPILAALPRTLLGLSAEGWAAAARGIMTTDTRPKVVSRRLTWQGQDITLTGMAKGAGMIKPNMATMLAFVATDAALAPDHLQTQVNAAVARSFNRITVDGDTSTNDACVVLATGRSGLTVAPVAADLWAAFGAVLQDLMQGLATAIIRDAEGATKFITVRVEGGATPDESLAVAYAIAESPLVKTALFASDPNWGRILAAIGRAGVVDLDVGTIDLYLGETLLARGGTRASGYTESQGQGEMAREDILIRVCLGRGQVTETVWTSDLSLDYVRINADYRS